MTHLILAMSLGEYSITVIIMVLMEKGSNTEREVKLNLNCTDLHCLLVRDQTRSSEVSAKGELPPKREELVVLSIRSKAKIKSFWF